MSTSKKRESKKRDQIASGNWTVGEPLVTLDYQEVKTLRSQHHELCARHEQLRAAFETLVVLVKTWRASAADTGDPMLPEKTAAAAFKDCADSLEKHIAGVFVSDANRWRPTDDDWRNGTVSVVMRGRKGDHTQTDAYAVYADYHKAWAAKDVFNDMRDGFDYWVDEGIPLRGTAK